MRRISAALVALDSRWRSCPGQPRTRPGTAPEPAGDASQAIAALRQAPVNLRNSLTLRHAPRILDGVAG
jgi:hypothetical protein